MSVSAFFLENCLIWFYNKLEFFDVGERMKYSRKSLTMFRYLMLVASVICLLTSILFLRQFAIKDADDENKPAPPLHVSHRVLFLSSYDSLYFTADPIKAGLEAGLYPNGVEYDVIYMDSKNYNTSTDLLTFHDFLKKRLSSSKRKYEAVILGDDAALEFAIQYQNELFKDLPLVFFGINDFDLAKKASEIENITGFYEQNYLIPTIELAMSLYPDVKHYVGLHDRSVAGLADYDEFVFCRDSYPDCTFTTIDVSYLTQSQLVSSLHQLPKDSILIYMTCYSDKWGMNYSIRSRTQTIAENTSVPIFRNYVCVENEMLIGGIYMDFEAQCTLVAHLIIDILNGKDINTIPLHTETPPRVVINWQQMKNRKLDFSKLPKNTTFYNRPLSFFDHYGPILPSASLLMIAMLLLVGVAYSSTLISRLTSQQLQESHDELERSHEELRYQAEHDENLDILNRRTATEYLRETLTLDKVYSMLIIDIDSFKELNESFGHQVADSILQYLTAVLRDKGKDGNWLLARYGGDEFLVMIPNMHLHTSHEIIVDLLETIRAPIPLGDESISMTASLGISNSDGITLPEQHISNAETAMYEAKNRGKNGAFLYGDEMKERAREEMVIKSKLSEAFENDGFYMLYQPQINSQTLEISGFEALVRMKAPGMYPGKFIPVAEKNGWIWRIGRMTTELAIKQLAAWQAEGKPLHPVSVNYSSNQLNDHGYVDYVFDLLEKYKVPSNYLEIEITEGLFLEKSALADQIFKRFNERGIRLLMDDFGTGYSSLGYLSYIPVDVIKLDKSLVDTYLVNGKEAFIRDVIQMMHDLGKEMIIEGVEEKWQFDRLREFGADTIQGYYFSKPIPADEAITFSVTI